MYSIVLKVKMLTSFSVLFIVLVFVAAAKSARILAYFQIPSPSHHFIFKAVIDELAKRGHEVVYVTPLPYDRPPKGVTQIVLKKLDFANDLDTDFIEIGKKTIPVMMKDMIKFGQILGEKTLPTKEVQDLIHSKEKFDAIISEPYFAQEYLSAFVHKFNAIGIDIITLGDFCWVNEMAGLPDNPAYQMDFNSVVPKDMDFWDRLYNTYVTAVLLLGDYFSLSLQQATVDKYFNYTGWETRPPIENIARNKSLILVNYDPLLGYPYPAAPHRKDIGGIHLKAKPLPKDLQKYMDESDAGVIYMSLGSHVNVSVTKSEIAIFLNAFRGIPQRVLLKFDEVYSGDVPSNVKISSWYPQQDILAHNKCVLFITHGGQLSLTEAVYFGVPMLGVPVFADQPKNTMFLEYVGLGKMIRLTDIAIETVSWTLKELLSNNRYKEEAVRRSKMFRDRRHTAAEEAGYWIEHSLKYPYSLTPQSASLSPIQLHLIDVKIFILSVLFVIFYSIYALVRFLMNFMLKRKNKIKIN